jgi:lipopolysaccharide/colanic/teichoic acid biosynthesis glycosyltransferase
MLIYFIIGLLWGALFEWLDNQAPVKSLADTDVLARVILVVLWPIMLTVFIISYLLNNRPPNGTA